jgi:hypothetical protein
MNGLGVSTVLRDLDIFAKTIFAAVSMAAVAASHSLVFGTQYTVESSIGMLLIMIALYFYYETAITKFRKIAP